MYKYHKMSLEEIESAPASNAQTDKFILLSRAVQVENESIIYYEDLQRQYPEWYNVLQDIIDEEYKHVGQLEKLRSTISKNLRENIEDGEEEAVKQLELAEEALKDERESEDKAPYEACAVEAENQNAIKSFILSKMSLNSDQLDRKYKIPEDEILRVYDIEIGESGIKWVLVYGASYVIDLATGTKKRFSDSEGSTLVNYLSSLARKNFRG